VAHLERRHVLGLLAEKAGTPAAANNLRKRLAALLDHAVDLGWRTDNPVRTTKAYRIEGNGHHTWDEGEIQRYLQEHVAGTTAHLAMMLMLYTGTARADAVRLGWANLKDGRLLYRRQKTIRTTGMLISIPLHPDLAAVLDTLPRDRLTFLETRAGKSRSPNGLGNQMRAWCDAAGLPECSSHGLRKACARRLAEAGATAHEIAAVTGHGTLAEVQRYTRDANRVSLADGAMAKLASTNEKQTLANHPARFAKKTDNMLIKKGN
jgi:integrase